MSHTILITDAVDPVCMEMLREAGMEADVQLKQPPEVLRRHAARADGWIIRSGTRIGADLIEAAENLKVIGRAGVGVDNIDVEAATRRGILVINAPDGNTISTAEHTVAMLLALARRIPQANASLREGKWDRKSFQGSELYEKTLGIVGVGKIGRAVAERMQGFGMTVLGYDPVLAPEVAGRLGITLVSLDEIFEKSDFITFHTPLNEATRGMLDAGALARCKRGVYIVNCARGGIVDEAALLAALEDGQVAGAALDVYSQEPPPPALAGLIAHPRVVATPHIAASTEEAQQKVARQVTEQVIRALRGEPVTSAVNAMAIRMAAHQEVQPYLRLAEKLGLIAGQLAAAHLNRVVVRCHGDVPQRYAEVLKIAVLKGLLSCSQSGPVNLINAPVLAGELGLDVVAEVRSGRDSFTNLIEVAVETDRTRREVAGAIFGADDPRLVRVDAFWFEVRAEGWLLFYRNVDRPGMLASVGGALAEAGINIGALALGRTGKGAMALTAISVDEAVPPEVLRRIAALEGVEDVHLIYV
ncbi:phosphoglycerate dehydrogenase [Rhodocaloribacter litoris]|uniref:phosphoglycerate dehydrogenase n=1 Tax=Rhodocaloribacter litoris TaxID=2558931 RepID=UPI001421E4FA|nr:phosphoglycerate dehydrogenase [Rhodocaloribacter litoris]QXD16750.1 phosphoglycerate dehydrogenase [Rhodocaloribacter litoris]GIV59251.1 MAG: D-3-phosphoglycerate dehydrogenase [Rhodothermaceae bacterium]